MKDFWEYQKEIIEDVLYDIPGVILVIVLVTLVIKFTWSLC